MLFFSSLPSFHFVLLLIDSSFSTESKGNLYQCTNGKFYSFLLQVAIGSPEKARRFGMRSGRENYFNNLIKFFPEEEAAIKKYEQLISVSTFALVTNDHFPWLIVYFHSCLCSSVDNFNIVCGVFVCMYVCVCVCVRLCVLLCVLMCAGGGWGRRVSALLLWLIAFARKGRISCMAIQNYAIMLPGS